MTSALKGGGGPGKADEVREFSKGGCVKMRTRGGGGQKIGKFCGRPKWTPLSVLQTVPICTNLLPYFVAYQMSG